MDRETDRDLSPHRVSGDRRRDIRAYLAGRCATTFQLARRFFPSDTLETSRKKANRWIVKERHRGRMPTRGVVVLRNSGRPQLVYGQRCASEWLEHEVLVTEAEYLLGVDFTRKAAIGAAVADGHFTRHGNAFWVEIDNETMTAEQMQQKWQRYPTVDGFILVICHTRARLRLLMQSAERVKQVALFSRFDWLARPQPREPWLDMTLQRTGIG